MAARARRPAGREDRDACPVCLDPFSTISQLHRKSRYPKLLPCDHCVCEGCTNDLRTEGLPASQPPHFFSGPICRGAVDCSATLQDNEAIVGAAPRTGEEEWLLSMGSMSPARRGAGLATGSASLSVVCHHFCSGRATDYRAQAAALREAYR